MSVSQLTVTAHIHTKPNTSGQMYKIWFSYNKRINVMDRSTAIEVDEVVEIEIQKG